MQLAVAGASIEVESPMGLPMSSVSRSASSVACSRIFSAKRSITRLRSLGAMVDQWPLSNALRAALTARSEEHTSELQSLMRISYAVFCLKTTTTHSSAYTATTNTTTHHPIHGTTPIPSRTTATNLP